MVLGEAKVEQKNNGIVFSGESQIPHTIVKLVFDESVETAVYDLIHEGSLFKQDELKTLVKENKLQILEKEFQTPVSFERFEFAIDNPNHLRGNGKPFQIEILSEEGEWKKIYEGEIFGLICGKQIDPVLAKGVRLVVQADKVRYFNVYHE